MARRNAILAGLLLAQVVWLGVRFFQSPAPSAASSRGLLLADWVPGEVLRLEIVAGSEDGQPAVVARDAASSPWRVPDVFDYRADGDKVDGALRDLASLEIASVVSSTAHHHVDFKVAESDFEKRIRLAVAGETLDLLFGSPGPAGTVHARRVGEDAVYAVRGYSSWRFAERGEDWLDKVYFAAPRDRVANVAISVSNEEASETTSFSLERAGEEGWVVVGPGGARFAAESSKVESFLRAVSRVSLSELVGRIDDDAVAFGDPVAEVRVALGEAVPEPEGAGAGDSAGGEIVETRSLRVSSAPGDAEHFWLHAEGSEFVAEVDRGAIGELLDARLEDFRAPVAEPPSGEADEVQPSAE